MDSSNCQIEQPDSWSFLLLKSFAGSPGLWSPVLSSQAANAISSSLCAPLLSPLLPSPSHMAYGHTLHFSNNFSSERTGHKQREDVQPAHFQPPPYSHCAQFGKWSSCVWLVRHVLEWFLSDIEFESQLMYFIQLLITQLKSLADKTTYNIISTIRLKHVAWYITEGRTNYLHLYSLAKFA